MNLFYSTDIDKDQIILSEEESNHVVKVMRSDKGSTIHVTDGKGRLFRTSVTDSKSKKCILKIEEEIFPELTQSCRLHVGIAPTKNHDRLEWFAEKATEIGISEITPLICRHSERKNVNAERLQRIMIAAMKQSNRFFLPVLNPEILFDKFVKNNFVSDKFIASCMNEDRPLLKKVYKPRSEACILIGPEGDFSIEEMDLAKQNGFISVSLGNNRFRTETAALIACHTIALMNE
jgi:16S rRNA (uracil1498-N3)-methyltransferase